MTGPTSSTTPSPLDAVKTRALELAEQPGAVDVLADVKEEVAEVQQTAKSGWKTSEFALTLLVALVGTGICAVKLWQGSLDMAGAGIFLSTVLSLMHYTKARTDLKTAHVSAAPSPAPGTVTLTPGAGPLGAITLEGGKVSTGSGS